MSAARSVAGVVTALYLAAEGFSALRIGELFLCVALTTAGLSTSIGLLSDRVGRKAFLVVVPLLATVAAVLYATVRAPAVLFVFAAAGSFGRGGGAGGGSVGPYQPAESAFVAEVVDPSVRNDAFGQLSFVSSLGALVGALLAILARPAPGVSGGAATAAYRPAFLAAAVLSAAAGLLALGLSEPERRRPRARRTLPRQSWHVLWRFWITNAVTGVAIGAFGPFVSYWFHRRYGASPAEIGVIFAVVNAATLASTLSAAGIARRLGTIRAIVAVRLIQGSLLIPMALAPDLWAAAGIYLVRMLAQRVGLPLRQSFIQGVADPDERAALAALSTVPAQATQAGSQVLAGYLFDETGLASPLIFSGVMMVAGGLLYARLFAGMDRKPEAAAPVLETEE